MGTRTLTRTHTIVELRVSHAAYDEIKAKLLQVEYDHVFVGENAIDMSGIAITPDDSASLMEAALREISGTRHGPDCPGFEAREIRFKCTCHVLKAKEALRSRGLET